MKIVRDIVLLIIVAGIFSIYLGSWMIVPVAFLSGYLYEKLGSKRWGIGFIAGFCLWVGVALFLDMRNDHLMSTQIAQLLGELSGTLLLLITGLLGALLASLSRLLGIQVYDMTIKSGQKGTVSS